MPRLRRLYVDCYDEGPRSCCIDSKNMPSLRIPSLENVFPEISVHQETRIALEALLPVEVLLRAQNQFSKACRVS